MSIQLYGEALARFPYKTTKEYDHLAWARRIIYRHERRDNDLHYVQVLFAYQAMGKEVPKL